MATLVSSTQQLAADPRTRAGMVSLVAGAVLLALGRVLATSGGSAADRLNQMTAHDAQVTAGTLLAIAGFCALVPGFLVLTPFAVAGYFLGPFLVSLGARRAGLLPRWLPWGVLASLILQPVGVGLGGPGLAHVVDTLCQLALVAMAVTIVRSVQRQTA